MGAAVLGLLLEEEGGPIWDLWAPLCRAAICRLWWRLVVGGGAEAKISSGKAGLWFWCCFSVTGGGRVEGKLREKMDDGEGKGRLV